MGAEVAFRELMLKQFHRIARRQFRADFTIMTYEGAVQHGDLPVAPRSSCGSAPARSSSGHLTIGALVAFNALVALANAPIDHLLTLWDNLQLATVLLDRLNDVFEQEPEQGADRSRLLPVRTLEGRISLRNVGFRYGGPESPAILEGITLDVPAGTHGRHRRTQRLRQDDAGQVPGRAAGAHRGHDPLRRRRPARRSTIATCAGRSASSCRRTISSTTRSPATSRSARTSRTWTG